MRQLADRQLARALDGAGERALARASLPVGAVVALQRIDITLRLGDGVAADELAEGWAAAFEARLARLLFTTPPGDGGGPDDDRATPLVWFPDPWSAERRHLERRTAGWPDAWWATDLAAGSPADAPAPDPLAPLAILLRWLARDPARAVAVMTALARADVRHAALLDPGTATRLARRLIRQLASAEIATGPAGQPLAPTPATALRLHAALERLAPLGRALTQAGSPAQAAPWLAAALFASAPSASRQPAGPLADAIDEALRRWSARPAPTLAANAAAARPPHGAPVAPAGADAASLAPVPTPSLASHPVHAGGLLLLLRPLVRLGLLPDAGQLAPRLGDLALAALRRVLAPLPPGERAAAEERERPLLAVFAPECDWREPIARIPLADGDAAQRLLDALVDAIPAEVAFAPAAERRVFGPAGARFATEPTRRLARLLLRPGTLDVTPWDAELTWPLASIDLALRRAGWDQDPGWLPWLGRTLRLRFGDAP